jgi:hypothetical protein
MTESVHNVEDLIAAVRALPPTAPDVVGRFATALFAKADEHGRVKGGDVHEIVMNWPGACLDGKEQFIELNRIVVASHGLFCWRFVYSSGHITKSNWSNSEHRFQSSKEAFADAMNYLFGDVVAIEVRPESEIRVEWQPGTFK